MSSSRRLAGMERREMLIELAIEFAKVDCDLREFLDNEQNISKAIQTQSNGLLNMRLIDLIRVDASKDDVKHIFAAVKGKKERDSRLTEALIRSQLKLPEKEFQRIGNQTSYPAVALVPPRWQEGLPNFGKAKQGPEMSFLEVDHQDVLRGGSFFVWVLAAQYAVYRGDKDMYAELVKWSKDNFKELAETLVEAQGKPTAEMVEEIKRIEENQLISWEEILQTTCRVHSFLARYSHSECLRTVNHLRTSAPTAIPFSPFEEFAIGTVMWTESKRCAKCKNLEHYKLIHEVPLNAFLVEGQKRTLYVNLSFSLMCNSFFPLELVLSKKKFYRHFIIATELSRKLSPRKLLFLVCNSDGELFATVSGKLTPFVQDREALGYQVNFVMYASSKPPTQKNPVKTELNQSRTSQLIVVERKEPCKSVPPLKPVKSKVLRISDQVARKHENEIPPWGTRTRPVPCCWLNFLIHVLQYFAKNEMQEVCWVMYRRVRGHAARELFKTICALKGEPSEKSEELRRQAVRDYVNAGFDTDLCLRNMMRTCTLFSIRKVCGRNHSTSIKTANQSNLNLIHFHMVIGLRFPTDALLCGESTCREPSKIHVKLDPRLLIVEGTTTNGEDRKLYLHAEQLFNDYPARVQVADQDYYLHIICTTEHYVPEKKKGRLRYQSPHGYNFIVYQGNVIKRVCDSAPFVWDEQHVEEDEVHGYAVTAACYVKEPQAPPPT